MIISKHDLTSNNINEVLGQLKSRLVSVLVTVAGVDVEIFGTYVPSRDQSIDKIEKKKLFINGLSKILQNKSTINYRVFCGDLNILEPNHKPHYSIFEPWEYSFYNNLKNYDFIDVYRKLNPSILEYSWVGRMGDGYRYDHCFASKSLAEKVKKCYYIHETRHLKLSDHSALSTEFNL